ncbi:MAG: class I SAM-dependent methyltransferase [Planctomycetota bacterium]
MNCIICSQPTTQLMARVVDSRTQEAFKIRWCPTCQHGVTEPVPANFDRFYGPSYYGNRHGRSLRWCNSRRARWVQKVSPNGAGRLLDIGCGDGSFMRHMHASGWSTFGVERDIRAEVHGDLQVLPDLSATLAHAPFDIISLWHCLEHVPDPGDLIEQALGQLTPDGSILVAVPRWNCLASRLFQGDWLHLDVPRHLHHFSDRSIKRLADQRGATLHPMRATEWEYDLMGWTQSTLNSLGLPPNRFLEHLMGRADLEPLGPVHRVLGYLLAGLALVPTFVGAGIGRGGTLVVQVQRRTLV